MRIAVSFVRNSGLRMRGSENVTCRCFRCSARRAIASRQRWLDSHRSNNTPATTAAAASGYQYISAPMTKKRGVRFAMTLTAKLEGCGGASLQKNLNGSRRETSRTVRVYDTGERSVG